MRTHLAKFNADKLSAFAALKNDMERKEWLAEYLLDPEEGTPFVNQVVWE